MYWQELEPPQILAFRNIGYVVLPYTNLILPIGISFYTFQIVSYLIDVYWKKVPSEKNLITLGTYITMFPQLIAGPIVKFSEVREQLHNRNFDFWGYSLMAIGLGKMIGFTFPANFNNPYTSRSMTEFWRRWHKTLGSWFKEYVYIPLGGSRHGKAKTLRNLFIVWILTGFWHGADWNFIIWGLLIFIIIAIEKAGLLSEQILLSIQDNKPYNAIKVNRKIYFYKKRTHNFLKHNIF